MKQLVQVEDRLLQLTNLAKVLWPQTGYTKADLLDYHVQIYPYTRKYWENRTLTLTRYPHGVDQDFFFQKNLPPAAPEWVSTFWQNDVEYVLATDLSTIIWLANLAVIEFHPSTYKISDPSIPSYALIDLDPTKPGGFQEAVEAAKYCRELLANLDLAGYPKFSGVSGIHIYIPLKPCYDFTVSSKLVRLIGRTLQEIYPDKITLERLIKNRRGVYLDYLQNHPSKTIVGVYSPRPTPTATVSTPVCWEDLAHYRPEDFTIKTVPQWLLERGDLFQGVLENPQSLEKCLQLI